MIVHVCMVSYGLAPKRLHFYVVSSALATEAADFYFVYCGLVVLLAGMDEAGACRATLERYVSCRLATEESVSCQPGEDGRMQCERIQRAWRLCPGHPVWTLAA